MALTRDDVDVTARIARGVVVPTDIHAVLQQATVLGDIYVALERPTPGRGTGARGARRRHDPAGADHLAPQLEDTIASLANFVSSGSIQRAQNSIIRLNRGHALQ